MRTAFAVSSSLCCSHPSSFIHQRRQCRGKARRKNFSGIKGDPQTVVHIMAHRSLRMKSGEVRASRWHTLCENWSFRFAGRMTTRRRHGTYSAYLSAFAVKMNRQRGSESRHHILRFTFYVTLFLLNLLLGHPTVVTTRTRFFYTQSSPYFQTLLAVLPLPLPV